MILLDSKQTFSFKFLSAVGTKRDVHTIKFMNLAVDNL